MKKLFPNAPDFQIDRELTNLRNGWIAPTGRVVLATGTTTTTVSNAFCHPDSVVLLTAENADAAAENPFVEAGNGEFIIHHSNASTTRVFGFALLGRRLR